MAFLVMLLFYTIYSYQLSLLILAIIALALLCNRFGIKETLFILLLLSLFSGFFTYRNSQASRAEASAPQSIPYLDIIPDSITINGDQMAFTGRYRTNHYQVFYRFTQKEEADRFKKETGFLRLKGDLKLEKVTGKRNFNGFDYQAYLRNQGIYHIIRVNDINSLTTQKIRHLRDYSHYLRRAAIVWSQEKFPKPMSHYMTGLLFGYLDKSFGQMTELYSQLGIIHLFALSGMQVGFFLQLFRRLLVLLNIPLATICVLELLFAFCYAGMTGYSVSVIRSLMQAQFRHLGLKGLDNLSITFLVMLVWDPYFLLTIGGVLSFAYAFMLTSLSFEELEGFKKTLAMTFAITVGMLPLLLYYFASFNPLSIVLTAFLSLLFDGLLLPLLTLSFVLSPFLKMSLFNIGFVGLEKLMILLGQCFSKPIVFGSPQLLHLLLCLTCLVYWYDHRSHRIKAFVSSMVFFLTIASISWPLGNEVTMVDIGQGDSIFIRDWQNKTLLIDVGGIVQFGRQESWRQRHSTSNAEKTLIPYLRSRGMTKIDQIVLTHTDTDHIGDMEEVVKAFRVREILISQGSLSSGQFVKRLKALKVSVRVVSASDKIPIMGSHLHVLYPWEMGDGKNNDSLVLYGKLLSHYFLFTGDLEAEGEEALRKRYPHLPVDILKAGHYGSKGSSSEALLDHINPKIALLSAGEHNRYKHPHQETLERFH